MLVFSDLHLSLFNFDFTPSGVFVCSFFVLCLNVGCCPEREFWWIHFECSWGLDCSSPTDLTTDPLVPMILKVGEISPSFGCHFKTTWLHLQVSICGPFCDSPGFSLIHKYHTDLVAVGSLSSVAYMLGFLGMHFHLLRCICFL